MTLTAAHPTSARVACSGCERTHRWKPERAGKKARCKCGGVLRFPREDPSRAREPEEFQLVDLPAAPVRRAEPKPVRRTPLRPREASVEQEVDRETLRAAALAGVGTLLVLVGLLRLQAGFSEALVLTLATALLGTGCSVITALVVGSTLFNSSFGALRPALFKFVAVTMVPTAIYLLLGSFGVGGALVGGLVASIAYWVLLIALFQLRFLEAFVFTVCYRIVERTVLVAILAKLASL
ncbi:MAG TPA: hypothetical protein DEA08_12940 [Planctomycetes bacterium]|nr:hypothetical protein [Planctomycetota bacterium]